jgi:4-alpha-glucanotransferase
VGREEADAFRARQAFWVEDWERFAGPGAVADQVRFDREWGALRAHARRRGVRLIGDLPFYVAARSADVRARPDLFLRGAVAGVPPDAFTADGQLWGHPLYDWGAIRADGYRWWVERLRRTLELVDVARIDHFRALVAYWAVPAGSPTARAGRWRRGPGAAPLRAARAELGELPLVAEDLGVITRPVERLRRELGLPGIRVLEFAFTASRPSPHLPSRHPEDAIVYVGTHDNDPAAAWWAAAAPATRRRVERELERLGIGEPEPAWALVRLALASPARIAVLQAQDLLGIGAEARMNRPGTATGNWRWRLPDGALTRELARRLRAAGAAAGRPG